MPLKVHDEALDQLWEIGARYAVRDMGRALRFERAYESALARIAADPTSHPLHHEALGPEVRYVRVARFPYLVLFRTSDPAETVVLAVLPVAGGPDRLRQAERRG